MKKLFAVLLSIVLVLSLSTVAFAAETGSIKITNAVDGETYDVYKMLDFEPIAGETDKGVYTVVPGWENFFGSAPATNYFKTQELDGKIVVDLATEDTEVDQTLAQAAIAYATDLANSISVTASETASGKNVEFTGLGLGYYAVDTSLGALCALTNTNSTETLVEKNAKPDITKQVQEDRDNSWGQVNDADINQVVNYKSVITVGAGATNYVMHDTMDKGLTFDPDSVVVEGADADDYTLTTSCDDGCTFEIAFSDAFIAEFQKGETFTVTYSATLNEEAKVAHDKGEDDYEGNKNVVYLEYFNETTVETDEHETVTFTWKIDVFKYTKEGGEKVPLEGAIFQLLDANENAIKVSPVDGADVPTYVVDPNGVEDIETDDTGVFVIIGLDEGVYTLTETDAPDGYNRAPDQDIVITSALDIGADDEPLAAEYYFYDATEPNEDDRNKAPTTIEVENKTGGLFPETGGIGTVIFTVVGVVLMLAAVVLFITKKRMSSVA